MHGSSSSTSGSYSVDPRSGLSNSDEKYPIPPQENQTGTTTTTTTTTTTNTNTNTDTKARGTGTETLRKAMNILWMGVNVVAVNWTSWCLREPINLAYKGMADTLADLTFGELPKGSPEALARDTLLTPIIVVATEGTLGALNFMGACVSGAMQWGVNSAMGSNYLETPTNDNFRVVLDNAITYSFVGMQGGRAIQAALSGDSKYTPLTPWGDNIQSVVWASGVAGLVSGSGAEIWVTLRDWNSGGLKLPALESKTSDALYDKVITGLGPQFDARPYAAIWQEFAREPVTRAPVLLFQAGHTAVNGVMQMYGAPAEVRAFLNGVLAMDVTYTRVNARGEYRRYLEVPEDKQQASIKAAGPEGGLKRHERALEYQASIDLVRKARSDTFSKGEKFVQHVVPAFTALTTFVAVNRGMEAFLGVIDRNLPQEFDGHNPTVNILLSGAGVVGGFLSIALMNRHVLERNPALPTIPTDVGTLVTKPSSVPRNIAILTVSGVGVGAFHALTGTGIYGATGSLTFGVLGMAAASTRDRKTLVTAEPTDAPHTPLSFQARHSGPTLLRARENLHAFCDAMSGPWRDGKAPVRTGIELRGTTVNRNRQTMNDQFRIPASVPHVHPFDAPIQEQEVQETLLDMKSGPQSSSSSSSSSSSFASSSPQDFVSPGSFASSAFSTPSRPSRPSGNDLSANDFLTPVKPKESKIESTPVTSSMRVQRGNITVTGRDGQKYSVQTRAGERPTLADLRGGRTLVITPHSPHEESCEVIIHGFKQTGTGLVVQLAGPANDDHLKNLASQVDSHYGPQTSLYDVPIPV